jgi:hypothetical protein
MGDEVSWRWRWGHMHRSSTGHLTLKTAIYGRISVPVGCTLITYDMCWLFYIFFNHITFCNVKNVMKMFKIFKSEAMHHNIILIQGGMVVHWLDLPKQSVPFTTNVVSSNPAQMSCTRYNIYIYFIWCKTILHKLVILIHCILLYGP